MQESYTDHQIPGLWSIQKNELNQFSTSLIELIHKSLEGSCINKKESPTVLRCKNW